MILTMKMVTVYLLILVSSYSAANFYFLNQVTEDPDFTLRDGSSTEIPSQSQTSSNILN